MNKKQIPNLITLTRLLATVTLIILFFTDIPNRFVWALLLFVYAGASDFIDGYLARRWKAVSPLGTVADPMLDKVLTISMYMLLIPYDIVHPAVFIALTAREIIVESIKNYQLSRGIITASVRSGKLKMLTQSFMLIFMLLYLIFPDSRMTWFFAAGLAALALILSYYSGSIYFRSFIKSLQTHE
jgi:CDP-diacylglycerol--glycerol-3-phosphate 3-phosphatidyltransferase